MKLSEKIRDLRKSLCKTQQNLCDDLNLPRYIISNWEQGRSSPSADDIITLAKIFDCTTDYLLGIDDDYGYSNAKSNAIVVNGKILNGDELELIDNFRKLSSTEQDVIKLQTKALANKNKNS